ncbi:MAG: hypothetical protein WA847_20230 [Terriglobales bacterium]
MKLDEWRLTAKIHQDEQAFIVLCAEVPQQVIPVSPLRFVAKRVKVAAFLKNPAT